MDNNKNVIVTSEEIGKQIEKLLHTRFGVSEILQLRAVTEMTPFLVYVACLNHGS